MKTLQGDLSLEEIAAKMANNHATFPDFAWHDQPEDQENWCIIHTASRDAGLIEQSNAAVIYKELEKYLGRTVRAEHMGHWACGWVDGYSIRVYFKNGKITKAFRHYCELMESLTNYPVLDETDYHKREFDATCENIATEGNRFLKDKATTDWTQQVFSWLWEYKQREVENVDDQGGYPSREAVKEAMLSLGLTDCLYRVEVDGATVLETESAAAAQKEFADQVYQSGLLYGDHKQEIVLTADLDWDESELRRHCKEYN